MRTTLNLDESTYREAVKATGVEAKTKLIHMGLQALIREASLKRLATLYKAIPKASASPRRKVR